MAKYIIVFESDQGSRRSDALATTVDGEWSNFVSNYDLHGHDLVHITVDDDESAHYLEDLLEEGRQIGDIIEWRIA